MYTKCNKCGSWTLNGFCNCNGSSNINPNNNRPCPPKPHIPSEPYIQNKISGIQMQLKGSTTTLANNALVVFNTPIIANNPNIIYNAGSFIFVKSGVFDISFQVVTDSSDVDSNLSFAIAKNGVPYSIASTNIVTGEISGSALIKINAGDIITLINVSSQNVVLGTVPTQANIVISN